MFYNLSNVLNVLLAVTAVIEIVRYSRAKLSKSLNICLLMLHLLKISETVEIFVICFIPI